MVEALNCSDCFYVLSFVVDDYYNIVSVGDKPASDVIFWTFMPYHSDLFRGSGVWFSFHIKLA